MCVRSAMVATDLIPTLWNCSFTWLAFISFSCGLLSNSPILSARYLPAAYKWHITDVHLLVGVSMAGKCSKESIITACRRLILNNDYCCLVQGIRKGRGESEQWDSQDWAWHGLSQTICSPCCNSLQADSVPSLHADIWKAIGGLCSSIGCL